MQLCNLTIIRKGNMNYFLFIADALHPILVNTLELFRDINALMKGKKKACFKHFSLLLIYMLYQSTRACSK